ncbi:SCF ubiquitin ligase complex subunit cdc4 [Vermiconidia calcicola]|uniref:SCF ubiquitin ligase complex subunit cdc4 n=1 Tax=Vermiconidia calcicola TaxID=1690605 RepID=A0ACC3N291_9PEZI|nr:SCF ubiquitin ligase complex subunit cdc4 [Vermiconidia calcicola]
MPSHKQTQLAHEDTTNTTATMPSPDMASQDSTVAQVSFGPATQQTVTTVTTTTTVSLPPLVMKPLKNLYERDPKQYPLAFSPTPSYLKRFCADVYGRPIHFHEQEDAQRTLRKHQELQARIQRHSGSIRSEERQSEYETPVRGSKAPQLSKNVHNVRASNAPKRTATPPSIAEAAELASLQRKTKKPRSQLQQLHAGVSELPSLNDRTASGEFGVTSNPAPVTPDTDAGAAASLPPRAGSSSHGGRRRRSPARPSRARLQELQHDVDEEDDMQMANSQLVAEDSQLGPPLYGGKNKIKRSVADESVVLGAAQPSGAAATPPIVETDLEPEPEPMPRADRWRPNLPSILTSSQQDASLPSPSLSPITAAANLASRQNAFDASFGEAIIKDETTASGLNLDDSTTDSGDFSFTSHPSNQRPKVPQFPTDYQQQRSSHDGNGPTVMDIPTMVDAFDSMPQAMQSYLIYQFLRRCSKPTLQMVANVVNPALKCDPFNVLPAELGLSIVRYLDVQSMCRAAQVSKRWRRHINSDEKAWKDLLERDSFFLPDGEIARAVKEGWGWQHPGEDGYEEDLSKHCSRHTPEHVSTSPVGTSVVSDDEETASSTVTTRIKRKSLAKHSSSSKKLKRRSVQVQASATKPSTSSSTTRLHRLLATAKGGPNGLAQAATQAVPHPTVGLPSLRNMHLFKSLYQRHYLIRKAWMMEESQPQHLAFRAHHRHVVTCLLFDGEKILTGSDDTKINVYDTKTGALKNRLEGHEGGVWALQYEGDTLVSGSTDRSVRVWDIKSGRCLQVFQGHTSTVRCLVILKPVQVDTAPDGTPILMPKEPLIITGSRDSTLRVWKLPQPGDRQIFHAGPPANDRDNPYFLRTLSGHHNSVRAIAAHGDTLISGSYDCTVRVWKISNGDLVHRLQGHTQKVYSVVLDHARARCISGSMDNLVKVWDLQSGTCLFNLEGHTSLVGLLDLSHDRLVSAAADSTLRIWDPESGTCKATLSAHTGAITCFQHDGQKVISGSDRTLKMWNVRNGECVKDLLTDLSGVWQVRFDERRCVAAVQRNNLTYIEVLDFGASRDGVPEDKRGRRVVVDCRGREIEDVEVTAVDTDAAAA